ncbi:transposase [Planctellipticum variicoloris]
MSAKRRTDTAEFKREAVELVKQQRLSVAEAARRPDAHANLLRQ